MTIKMDKSEIDLEALAKEAMELRDFLVDFSDDVEVELKSINEGTIYDNDEQVKDMRDKLFFSIDNDDSKDLDQLSYAEQTTAQMVKIYVAIADVNSTVKKGSAINEHAEHNTTSVYTPTIIFPMLPEKLSTNLTSLNENEDRNAYVAEMDIDDQGIMQAFKIYKALVRNHAKLAYNGVGAWLEGGVAPSKVEANIQLQDQLKLHDTIAQKMKARRQAVGSLSLETVEPHAIIKNRMIVDIVEERKNRAKEIIENFMISANTAATKFLHEANFPAFKRIVRVPKRWDKIVEIAFKLGSNLPTEPDSKALENFLIKQKAKDPVRFPDLSLSVVKLLGRGEYVVEYPGEDLLGHFGLALRNYSHSTAPNRRYPDLITQRMIRAVLEVKDCPYKKNELERLAEQCSRKEADADKVTRQTQKSAAAILLSDKINQTFEGLITGSKVDGTFVRIFQPPVEGKVVKGGNKVDVGDRVKVKLLNVNVEKGFIDFMLVD